MANQENVEVQLSRATKYMRNHFVMFSRNGRWGTCADCPRDATGMAFPEFCTNTKRSDHLLSVKDLAHQWTIRTEPGQSM